MPEWSEVLVVLRTVRDWSQKQLAAAMHVRTSTISDYERGEKTLSRPTLERMVTAMGYPLLTIDRTVSYLRGLPRPGAASTDAEEAVARQIDETAAGFGFEVEAFLRSLFSRVSEESRALADHEIARSLWFRLRRHPQPGRLAIVQAGAEFWSPALCELLCEESVQAAADDADRAVEVADLAVAVARLTPGGEARRSRLLGRAMGFLGNALRVRGDLPAADAAFARSAELWRAGADSSGPLEDVRLLELEASLRRAQRRLPESRVLLDRALAADQGGAATGRLLVLRAKTLEELGAYEEAVSTLRRAIPFVDTAREPRTHLVLRFNLLENLHQTGRSAEALTMLTEVRERTIDLGNDLDLLRLLWLEARLDAGLGRTAEAIEALERVRGDFVARGIAYDAALVTLEKAVLLLEAGRTSEVKELAQLTTRIFCSQGVKREALASLWVFCDAADRETLTVARLRELLTELRDARPGR